MSCLISPQTLFAAKVDGLFRSGAEILVTPTATSLLSRASPPESLIAKTAELMRPWVLTSTDCRRAMSFRHWMEMLGLLGQKEMCERIERAVNCYGEIDERPVGLSGAITTGVEFSEAGRRDGRTVSSANRRLGLGKQRGALAEPLLER